MQSKLTMWMKSNGLWHHAHLYGLLSVSIQPCPSVSLQVCTNPHLLLFAGLSRITPNNLLVQES